MAVNWFDHISGFRTQRCLRRTWRTVAALAREGMATSSQSVFSTAPYQTSMTPATPPHWKNKHWAVFVRFSPKTVARQASAVGRKSFWQLRSRNDSQPRPRWTLGAEASLTHPRLSPLHHCELLWPVSPSCPLCGVSGRAAFIAPFDRSSFPRFAPPSPGIMRTWRRRMNFVSLIFALRVWCLSMATENADNTVYNVQEGKYAALRIVKICSISHLAHFLVA